jgi:hypothetical protein
LYKAVPLGTVTPLTATLSLPAELNIPTGWGEAAKEASAKTSKPTITVALLTNIASSSRKKLPLAFVELLQLHLEATHSGGIEDLSSIVTIENRFSVQSGSLVKTILPNLRTDSSEKSATPWTRPGLGAPHRAETRGLHPLSAGLFGGPARSTAGGGVRLDAAGSGPRETRLIRFEALEAGVAQAGFSSRFRYT